MTEHALSRRQFLGRVTPLIAGVAAGMAIGPVATELDTVAEDITGHKTGNANVDEQVQEACVNNKDPKTCEKDYRWPLGDKLEIVVAAPLVEEATFRALPSVLVDLFEDYALSNEDPVEVLRHGTERARFTRGEIITGGASSVLFGLAHDSTRKGFEAKRIPAGETLFGGMQWILQRRFGFVSNLAAHVTLNGIGLNSK